MAEERNESREMTWRSLLPWTELFRGFQLALDPNKLFLAAIGIFLMAFAWWILAFLFGLFYQDIPPDFKQNYLNTHQDADASQKRVLWAEFAHERRKWNLMHHATAMGNKNKVQTFELEDLVVNYSDYELLTQAREDYLRARKAADAKVPVFQTPAEEYAYLIEQLPPDKLEESKDLLLAKVKVKLGARKPAGQLNTWPWSEGRGPNPFLLATGQAGRQWEAGHFWDWFLRVQLPVVIEPVVKIVLPLVFFFNPDASGLPALYFFLVFAVTVAIWSVVGGAITRIAAVQIARGEKIDFMEAVRFTLKRWASYLMAPVYPLAFVIVLVIFAMIFGLFHLIPGFGDIIVDGIFWPIPLVLGFVIALAVVGLVVGWPLMPPTISTEGTDSWEALSRSFSYVFQKPFHYLWYALVAMSYGAVLIFFVGFMGSFTVYLSKWAVSRTPSITYASSRDPGYLSVYAPDSFGWRPLLLKDTLYNGDPLVIDGRINDPVYDRFLHSNDSEAMQWWNKVGAFMVAFWLYLVFLLIIGFGYSVFWSLTDVIYFLLRRNVDAAEMDEVYLEEDEHDLAYSGPLTPPSSPPPPGPPKTDQAPQTMVESPALRTAGPTTTTPLPATTLAAPPNTAEPPGTEPAKPTTEGKPPTPTP